MNKVIKLNNTAKKCMAKFKELSKFLSKHKMCVIYDEEMDTLLAAPKGIRWNNSCCEDTPAGYREVTMSEMNGWCRLLPCHSVFYYNSCDDKEYGVITGECRQFNPLKTRCENPVISEARRIAGELVTIAGEAGCTLLYDYGPGHIELIKGKPVRYETIDLPKGVDEWPDETGNVCDRVLAVYVGDDPDGDLIVPD